MSPIRQPRKRARKRSVSFAALLWLVRREAEFQIWCQHMGLADHQGRREWWLANIRRHRHYYELRWQRQQAERG